MYFEKIVDAITGEEYIREYSEAEIASIKEAEIEAAVITQKINEAIAARKMILDKLGLTEEEAKLLLG